MNKKVIFDASVLLALLQEEKGSDEVKSLLDRSIMSAVNVSEVLNVLGRNGVSIAESTAHVKDIITEIISFDIEQAALNAKLSSDTSIKGLSLGDRACIALGIQMRLPVYTADRLWQKVNLPDVDIVVIR